MKTKTKAEQSKNKQRWSLRCIALIMEITFFNYRSFPAITPTQRLQTHRPVPSQDHASSTPAFPRYIDREMEGLKCLHHISEAFSDKICPDYFDYDNTGDFDGSIFIFWARLIVSRKGGFFIQTTTTTRLGSAVLIPSEDSLGVAATSPRQRKNGEGATLRFWLSGGGCSYR